MRLELEAIILYDKDGTVAEIVVTDVEQRHREDNDIVIWHFDRDHIKVREAQEEVWT